MTSLTSSPELSQGAFAYHRLTEAIRSGKYKPGDRLREADVAERLDLSRTPVREALRRLEAEGVVEHSPRIGATIRRLGHTEMVELYETRMVLERTAAEMSAKHAAPAEIALLEQLNDTIMASTGAPDKASAANQDFHRCIYMAARNRFLLEAARTLNNALMLMGPTTLADPERLAEVAAEHAAIIAGLRDGDARAAGDAAERHLQASLRHRLAGLLE